MKEFKEIKTDKVPVAVGPYSQAIAAGDFVFCSGQIGLDPGTGDLVGSDLSDQTRQALTNLNNVLAAAGLGFKDVVRTDIFLTNMNDFSTVNEIYASFFQSDPKPARQTVCVTSLPKGAKIEISAIAYLGEK